MLENSNTSAAVIGHPIAHSRSPMIHNYWLSKYNIPGIYDALDINPKHLEGFCQILRESEVKGINVTIPHKEAVMRYCDEIDETARKIGAVNTIQVRGDKLFGTNTDAYGFIENLKITAPAFNIAQARPLVIGAGGAARAVLYGLLEEGVKQITLTNRTLEKAERLADDFHAIKVTDWEKREQDIPNHNLIINTTSLGMHGQPALELNLEHLQKNSVAYDLIYNPLQTTFLRQAKAKGCQTVGGLGMLAYQAQKAFALWFDVLPDVSDTLISRLEESL